MRSILRSILLGLVLTAAPVMAQERALVPLEVRPGPAKEAVSEGPWRRSLANPRELHHAPTAEAFRGFRGVLLTTEPVLTEAVFLLGRAPGGAERCLEFFLQGGATLVPASRPALERVLRILRRYGDFPADFADATLVALAEELDVWTVFTLDRRGFTVYRGSDGQAFEIVP